MIMTASPVAAKTLRKDGFDNMTVISSADRVGGVWAQGDYGGVPGLLWSVQSAPDIHANCKEDQQCLREL